jgi:hypothetical protein
MKTSKISDLEQAVVPIDKSLERFRGRVLFPEKVEMTRSILAKGGLPKSQNQKSKV